MILFSAISGFVNGIVVTIFGLLVLLHNPRRKVNRLMALMCASVAVWSIGWVFFAIIKSVILILFFSRILNFVAIFIPIFFLHWVLVLLEIDKERRSKIILILGYSLTFFFAFFAFSSYFLTTKESTSFFLFYPKAGILHPFYLIFCYIGLAGYALFELLKSYKKSVGYKRAQIKYVLLGSILGFGGGATNFLLFYNIPIPPFGNPLVAVCFGLLTYAIVRYRLMDIKIIFGKGVAYIFSLTTIIGAGILLVFLNNQLNTPLPFSVIISFIAVLSILLFQLHKFYEKLTARYFYPDFYNTKTTISELEERLTKILELETLSSLVINTITNTFKLYKAAILIKEIDKKEYIIQKAVNFKKEELTFLIRESFFISHLEKEKKLIIKEELKEIGEKLNNQRFQDLQNKIEKQDIEVFLPIIFEKKVIGIIILGNKISGEAFSTQDLELLTVLSRHFSTALKNASLFAEINKRKEELTRFYRLIVGRELKMVELEKKIIELEEKLKKRK